MSKAGHVFPNLPAICLGEIEDVPPSAWLGHGSFALWLVGVMRPSSIVELGTYWGFSFFAFCQAMRDLGLEGTVTGVDTWQGDKHAGALDDRSYNYVRTIAERKYAAQARLMKMTFDEAAGRIDDQSVDIVHIDGLHTLEAVTHDYETWRPKVRPGGVILFHDICERRSDFGVWKLWEDLSAQCPTFELHHSHGLGVLGVGDGFAPDLSRLFALGRDSGTAAYFRRLFERLGQSAYLRAVVDDREKKLKAMQQSRDALAAEVDKLRARQG